jgi:predicted metal-binding membrane protein
MRDVGFLIKLTARTYRAWRDTLMVARDGVTPRSAASMRSLIMRLADVNAMERPCWMTCAHGCDMARVSTACFSAMSLMRILFRVTTMTLASFIVNLCSAKLGATGDVLTPCDTAQSGTP